PARAAVQMGVSFRSKSGNYCRTFQLPERVAGLACLQDDEWRIEVLASTPGAQEGRSEYRAAGSALPPSVLRAVDESISGEPLDDNGEARAKAAKWRTQKEQR